MKFDSVPKHDYSESYLKVILFSLPGSNIKLIQEVPSPPVFIYELSFGIYFKNMFSEIFILILEI